MSENSNIKVVRFIDGRKEGYGQALYAHDYGQKIRIEGLELPGNYEVHFSDVLGGAGVPRLATDNVVEVPRGYMHHPGNLYLWIYLNLGGSDGTTCYKATIPILPKADGYVEMTEEEQTIVDDMITSLNAASDRVAHAKDVLDQMQEIVDGVDAMPKAHYGICGFIGSSGDVIFYVPDIDNPLYPSPSVRSQAANCAELNFLLPKGYEPKENDLFMIKATADLKVPENNYGYKYTAFMIRFYHQIDTEDGPMDWSDTSDLHLVYNIAYNYPIGTQMFDKDRVYIFRYRKRTSSDPGWTNWPGHEYGFDILNYVPGLKSMVDAAKETMDEARELIGAKAVRYDISQELTAEQQLQARENISAAGLDTNGKVLTSQLPSFVDDVLEFATRSAFPAEGESGKIYVDLETNLTYRWGGSAYVEISQSLALGETSSTAFPGDRGKKTEDDLKAVVKVQETQPVEDANKIWIDETGDDEVTVPTIQEFHSLIKVQDQQPTEADNRLWIDEEATDEVQVVTVDDFNALAERVTALEAAIESLT